MTNIITACFGGTRFTNTRPAWLIDHGMVLQIKGVELPESYFVDFANSKAEQATRVLGNADGVVIPDQYFLSNAPQIFAWVYLTTGDSGFTTLQITIPLSQRPDVSTEQPTPQEISLIEQAIAALNDGVDRAEAAADLLENCTATATTLEPHSEATASYDNGVFTFGIPRGADGSGGGGGTGDYNDLTNKPSINGNVLSGNQTAAQLGLATPSDIPTVPVQSVNGKTGAVVLGASDVGALPADTAIPSKTSDLTNNSGFVNAAGAASAAPVQSVNGQTGAVNLTIPSTAADVGAMDASDYTSETWTFTLFDNTTVTKKVVVEA